MRFVNLHNKEIVFSGESCNFFTIMGYFAGIMKRADIELGGDNYEEFMQYFSNHCNTQTQLNDLIKELEKDFNCKIIFEK